MAKFLIFLISFLVGVVLGLVFAMILAFPVMWLWNYAAVGAVTFAKPIGFWTAFCLNFLCGLLIRSGATVSKSNS